MADKLGSFQRIAFVPARNADAHSIKPADLGFIRLNDPIEPAGEMGRPSGAPTPKTKPRSQELFKAEDVTMQWMQQRRVGSGLANLGNTCFMNSVLQCLLHTPPLAELLLSKRLLTAAAGDAKGYDPITMTRQLLEESLGRRDYASPRAHAKSLRSVSRSFRLGRQEDAHEYLIALLDAMHERSIAGITPKPPPEIEFTSFIYRIFGGRIRSQVKCSECDYASNTYDPFLDLSLEINHASSVEKALKRFTHGEVLDGANKYKCPKQKRGVRAVKRITIESAPPVLVVQLKRFEFSMSGRKISKAVEFGPTLDLSPYMSEKPKDPVKYDLYGVLVHQGHSMHSGHYFCFVRAGPNGDWHKFDDTRVAATAERNVLGQHAYILFYIRRQKKGLMAGPAPAPKAAPAAAATLVGAAEKQVAKKAKREKENSAAVAAAVSPVEGKKAAVAAAAKKAAAEAAEAPANKRKRQREAAEEPAAAKKGKSLMPPTLDDEKPPKRRPKRSQGEEDAAEDEDAEDLPVRVTRQASKMVRAPMSPIKLGGRRQKRLQESRLLTQARFKAVKKAGRAMGDSPVPAAGKDAAAAAPRTRRRLIAVEQQERKLEEKRAARKRKAAAPPDSDFDDTNSLGSAISAPEWPPVKSPSSTAAAGVSGRGRPASAARSADKSAVKEFLRSSSRGAGALAVDTWEDVDTAEKQRHDRLLNKAMPGRKLQDEYDIEYDKGKTKKVRTGRSRGGEGLDAAVFDEAAKTGKGRGDVQLRGKKKKAAEMRERREGGTPGRRASGGGRRGGRK